MSDNDLALEAVGLRLNPYLRTQTVSKSIHLNQPPKNLEELQLPYIAVIHTLDGITDPYQATFPKLTSPLYVNDSRNIHYSDVLEFSTQDDFKPEGKIRFNGARYRSLARSFYEEHRGFIRRAVNDSFTRRDVLPVLNYNLLLKSTIPTGRIKWHRKLTAILKTVLGQISNLEYDGSLPERRHIVHLPMSGSIFTYQTHFMKPLDKITPTTLKVQGDMSFDILLHLLGCVMGSNQSELWNFRVKYKDTFENIDFMLTCGEYYLIYPGTYLNEIIDGANGISESRRYALRMLKQINMLKLMGTGSLDPDVLEAGDDLDTLIEASKSEEDIPEPELTEEDTLPIENSRDTAFTPDEYGDTALPIERPEANYRESIAHTLVEAVETSEQTLTKRQKDLFTEGTLSGYREIEVGGKSILRHMEDVDTQDEDIAMTASESLKGSIPDDTMLESRIMNFDEHYLKKHLDKDIALVLAGFTKAGFVLSKVETEDTINSFERVRQYKVQIRDITGKKHNLNFKLPIVNPEDSSILVNGIKSRMAKQQSNLPICKIAPHRVNLSSNFNKTLIERTDSKTTEFAAPLLEYVMERTTGVKAFEVQFHKLPSDIEFPYDYQVLGTKIRTAILDNPLTGFTLTFDYKDRHMYLPNRKVSKEAVKVDETLLQSLERKYKGIYVGYVNDGFLIFGQDNLIRSVDMKTLEVKETFSLRSFLIPRLGGVTPKLRTEWVELKIRDKNIPIIFILGYMQGLSNTLKEMKAQYRFVPSGSRLNLGLDEISVKFADGTLIFPRYPLQKSLILSGLNKFKTENYMFLDLDVQDIYFTMLEDIGYSTNYLKAIRTFFALFVDPITYDVLKQMGEPTDVKGLLYRGTEMLTTQYAKPPASMANHRLRGYERIPGLMYNRISREIDRYMSGHNINQRVSINPNDVMMGILQDPTLMPFEDINPAHASRQKTQVTHTGFGGRTGQAFVLSDRKYPEDAVGILSEATPDSGKVGITAYYSVNAKIKNARGLYDTTERKLNPTEILSAPASLMPGASQDD